MAQKKKKSFNFNRLKIFVLIGVLVYAGLTFFNQQTILATQASKQAELLAQEEELTKQIEYYNNEQNYIGSSDYIEQEARDRLGWVYPEETKYVEAENGSAEPSEPASPEPSGDASPPEAAPSPQPSE